MNCRGTFRVAIIFAMGLPVLVRADGPQLDIRLRLDKAKFEVGEAIPATISIVNNGNTDYLLQASTEPTGALDGWSFTVTDSEGVMVACPTALLRSSNWIGSWLTLRRHEKSERKFFLNHWVAPMVPGQYVVTASYLPRTVAGNVPRDWPVVQTSRIAFHIAPTTSTKLDVRISRLGDDAAKGDLLAVDFLGFTGENAAIAPLLDAVYSDDLRVQRRAAFALSYLIDRPAVIEAGIARVKEHGPNPVLAEWLSQAGASMQTLLPLYFAAVSSNAANQRAGAFTGLRLCLGSSALTTSEAVFVRRAMRRGLQDADSRVRYEAVLGTKLADDADTIAEFNKLVRSDSASRVREAAAAALRELPDGKP